MAITITTLNNNAAVAKTFTEQGKSLTEAQWYNTTDQAATYSNRIVIKQMNNAGRDARGNQLRRSQVQCVIERPIEIVNPVNGAIKQASEKVTCTVSIVAAPLSPTMTSADKQDVVEYLRNFLTDSVVTSLTNGEI